MINGNIQIESSLVYQNNAREIPVPIDANILFLKLCSFLAKNIYKYPAIIIIASDGIIAFL